MRRREFIAAIGGAAAWPSVAWAQQPKKLPKLAYLTGGFPRNPYELSFYKGLHDLGYVEGTNIQIDARYASGKLELLPALANELVNQKPDVLIAAAAVGALAAKNATSTIPIVALGMPNADAKGLFKSLATPGGNITGIVSMNEVSSAKRVAILKEIVPQLSNLTLLYTKNSPYVPAQLEITLGALETLGIKSQTVEVATLAECNSALEMMRRDPPQALLLFLDPLMAAEEPKIIEFSLTYKVPLTGEDVLWVKHGQLVSYGTNVLDIWYRGGYYVDKILKGADVTSLPIEQPTKLDLAINLKTAREFGLNIPDKLLALATDVFE